MLPSISSISSMLIILVILFVIIFVIKFIVFDPLQFRINEHEDSISLLHKTSLILAQNVKQLAFTLQNQSSTSTSAVEEPTLVKNIVFPTDEHPYEIDLHREEQEEEDTPQMVIISVIKQEQEQDQDTNENPVITSYFDIDNFNDDQVLELEQENLSGNNDIIDLEEIEETLSVNNDVIELEQPQKQQPIEETTKKNNGGRKKKT